jgi:hypothetical protein
MRLLKRIRSLRKVKMIIETLIRHERRQLLLAQKVKVLFSKRVQLHVQPLPNRILFYTTSTCLTATLSFFLKILSLLYSNMVILKNC